MKPYACGACCGHALGRIFTLNVTYGDQITLRAAADFYNIEIVIVSTLGPDA